MTFALENYVPVAERITVWYARFPDGRIEADPPTVITIDGKSFVLCTARVFRSEEDPQPCQGSAWEVFPGPTNFTKDSEAQNAETSAVGRALALAGIEVQRGFASREEVRNRQPDAAPDVHSAAVDLQARLDVLPAAIRAKALDGANKASAVPVERVADACGTEAWVTWWGDLLTKAEKAAAEPPPETYPPEDEEPF